MYLYVSLDPQNLWHVVTKDICGTQMTDFLKNEMSRKFPEEIRSVLPSELLPSKSANSANFNMMPSTVYVAATFGLKGGLLHLSQLLTSSAQLCYTCRSMPRRTSPLSNFSFSCLLSSTFFHIPSGNHGLLALLAMPSICNNNII